MKNYAKVVCALSLIANLHAGIVRLVILEKEEKNGKPTRVVLWSDIHGSRDEHEEEHKKNILSNSAQLLLELPSHQYMKIFKELYDTRYVISTMFEEEFKKSAQQLTRKLYSMKRLIDIMPLLGL